MKDRKVKIVEQYFQLMDKHLEDVKNGESKVLGLKSISEQMHIHPRHLSNTVKNITGYSPCHFFELGLISVCKELLQYKDNKISDVAFNLDYDPSNFTKFFKHYTGQTPTQFKNSLHKKN